MYDNVVNNFAMNMGVYIFLQAFLKPEKYPRIKAVYLLLRSHGFGKGGQGGGRGGAPWTQQKLAEC